jgi:hypothetical protein
MLLCFPLAYNDIINMTKLKPVGIPQEEYIEPHTKIIPDRVQKLAFSKWYSIIMLNWDRSFTRV